MPPHWLRDVRFGTTVPVVFSAVPDRSARRCFEFASQVGPFVDAGDFAVGEVPVEISDVRLLVALTFPAGRGRVPVAGPENETQC